MIHGRLASRMVSACDADHDTGRRRRVCTGTGPGRCSIAVRRCEFPAAVVRPDVEARDAQALEEAGQSVADPFRQLVELVEDGLDCRGVVSADAPRDLSIVGGHGVREERAAGGLARGEIADPRFDAGASRNRQMMASVVRSRAARACSKSRPYSAIRSLGESGAVVMSQTSGVGLVLVAMEVTVDSGVMSRVNVLS